MAVFKLVGSRSSLKMWTVKKLKGENDFSIFSLHEKKNFLLFEALKG